MYQPRSPTQPSGSASALTRMFVARKSAPPLKEKAETTLVGRPKAGAASAASTRGRRGECANMTPSQRTAFLSLASRSQPSSASAESAHGFSSSTDLPAASARGTHSACSAVGSGMYTASTAASASSASYEAYTRAPGGGGGAREAAHAAARAASRDATPAKTAPAARESAR